MRRLWTICLQIGLLLLAVSATAAEPIAASSKLPDTMPWDLAELSKPPSFEWIDRNANVRSLVYEGMPYAGKPTRVFAYYATPGTLAGNDSNEQKFPAVVLVHGGGGTAFREWAELWAQRGYAAIAMDLAGHRPIEGKNPHEGDSRERLSDAGPDQGDEEKFGSIDKSPTEQWPYHAVADVIRAHSLVRSFPEIDAEKTAITGISWGGYLTCITASVDNRFKAAVPVYGCGFLHENSAWLDRFSMMKPEQRERWIQLWDPSRYLPAASMPMLFVNGTNDFAYPLDSYMKSFDLVPSEKQLCVTVNMPHGHQAGWAPVEIGLFIDQHLRGGEALPKLDEPNLDGDTVHVHYSAPRPLAQTALHVTTDTNAINQRQWSSSPAQIGNGTISVKAPPANATAWFVTVTDDRGAVVSSRTFFANRTTAE